jgi:hypothetical protein
MSNTPYILEVKAIKAIPVDATFTIPAYQRGYRWGKSHVVKLLNDIEEKRRIDSSQSYFLQPIVLKMKDKKQFELVDGQQRLTTLWMIKHYLAEKRNRPAMANPYTLVYETRQESTQFLNKLACNSNSNNPQTIDEDYFVKVYTCIDTWFSELLHDNYDPDAEYIVWSKYLNEQVKIIWYEIHNEDESGETIFMNLNRGRIPLTNSELIKALLLAHVADGNESEFESRQIELTSQWDEMEQDLHNPAFWAFLAGNAIIKQDDSPRLNYIFDLFCPTEDDHDDDYRTFDAYDTMIKSWKRTEQYDSRGNFIIQGIWRNNIRAKFLRLKEWFNDRAFYHKIGYLIAVKEDVKDRKNLLSDFLQSTKMKSAFMAEVDSAIKTDLKGGRPKDPPIELADLSYERNAGQLEKILLLFNVLSCMDEGKTIDQRALSGVNTMERYSFEQHHVGKWSLEHVNPQSEGRLAKSQTKEKTSDWMAWLKEHAKYLSLKLYEEESKENDRLKLKKEMGDLFIKGEGHLTEAVFQNLRERIVSYFNKDFADLEHKMGNLALLSKDQNSSLSNNIFVSKRDAILKMCAGGAFVPLCTRRLFLKYYCQDVEQDKEANVEQPLDILRYSFVVWTKDDATFYADAVETTLNNYL